MAKRKKIFSHKPKVGTRQKYVVLEKRIYWIRVFGEEIQSISKEEFDWIDSFWKAKQIFNWYRNCGKARGVPYPITNEVIPWERIK